MKIELVTRLVIDELINLLPNSQDAKRLRAQTYVLAEFLRIPLWLNSHKGHLLLGEVERRFHAEKRSISP